MQIDEAQLLKVERRFFSALLGAQPEALDELLTDDFLLIDVMSGSEVTKSALLDVMRSGQLKFEEINQLDSRIRWYDGTAVVTGSTKMRGRFAEESFRVSSRYTHVYAKAGDAWQLASAQGTPISNL